MAADWQQDAKHLESLDPSDREKLAEKLRMALGKKKKTTQQKPRKTAPSAGSESKGFSPTSGDVTAPASVEHRGERSGDGRDVLASAAAAAGAVTANDVGGVAVFPSASVADPPAADGDAAADGDVDVRSEEEALRSGVAAFAGQTSRDGGAVSAAGVVGGDQAAFVDEEASNDIDPSGSVDAPAVVASAAEAEAEEGDAPRGGGKSADVGDEVGRDGGENPPKRVMSFGKGKGVAVVEPGGSSADSSPPVLDPTASLSPELASAGGSSDGGSKLSNVRNFGRGVSMIPEAASGDGEAEEEEESVAAGKGNQGGYDADSRLTGFGKGVAFPVKTDP